MKKLMVFAGLSFVMMVVAGHIGLIFIRSGYRQGFFVGIFTGVFLIFFFAFLKAWLRKKYEEE